MCLSIILTTGAYAGNAGVFRKDEITDQVKKRITGLSYKSNCTVPYSDLNYLVVSYVDFNGNDCTGEIICNKAIADDLLDIFRNLYNARYQIDKIRLVDEYGADDDLSCLDDNTSCFNFRTVEGSRSLSKHALGLAIDINPFYNPYVTYPGGKIRISPPGSEAYADRNAVFPHKIDKNDLAYKEFIAHGFTWGGDWKSLKDYQHFQKAK
ncbi:MAG: M15 family metallopeptidase [Lachnospiraceae bacterium]|nr:M15 family metallopeptidase [Lachnospiraceae bacterium]